MAGRKELPAEEKKIRIEPFVKRKIVSRIGKKECETIAVVAINKEYEKRLKSWKTAVQELLDDLLSGKIIDTLAKSEYYIEKEKKQIIDACEFEIMMGGFDGKQYYNEKFKNKTP